MPPRERDPETAIAVRRAVQVARVRKRLTRLQLAEAAGLSRDLVGRIERGEREPLVGVAARLARALGMRPGRLLDAMEEEQEGRPSARS